MTLQALNAQYRELGIVLDRLESARVRLIPPAPDSWLGVARHAYDAALDGVVMATEAGLGALRSARQRTEIAIWWMHRG